MTWMPSEEALAQGRRILRSRGGLNAFDMEDVFQDAVERCLVKRPEHPDSFFVAMVGYGRLKFFDRERAEQRANRQWSDTHRHDGVPSQRLTTRPTLYGEAYRKKLRAQQRAARQRRTGALRAA